MSNPNNTTSIEELIKHYQKRWTIEVTGDWELEFAELLEEALMDTIKRVEEEVIGKEITIDDVANLDLPKIYTNEVEARKDLWEEAKKLNSLREHLLTKLSSMKEKGMK